MFSVAAKSTSLLAHRAVAFHRSFVAVQQQAVAATGVVVGIGALSIRRDFTAGKTAGEEDKEEEPKNKVKQIQFRTNSQQYHEFFDMVTEKGWLEKGKMPQNGKDKDLDQFMFDNDFDRTRVQRKFLTIRKEQNKSSEEKEEEDK